MREFTILGTPTVEKRTFLNIIMFSDIFLSFYSGKKIYMCSRSSDLPVFYNIQVWNLYNHTLESVGFKNSKKTHVWEIVEWYTHKYNARIYSKFFRACVACEYEVYDRHFFLRVFYLGKRAHILIHIHLLFLEKRIFCIQVGKPWRYWIKIPRNFDESCIHFTTILEFLGQKKVRLHLYSRISLNIVMSLECLVTVNWWQR